MNANDHAPQIATDGACGLSWDDSISTSYTPAPSARCQFEGFHRYAADGETLPLEVSDIPEDFPVRPTGDLANLPLPVAFFYRHAGYSHRPDEDPAEGHLRSARDLARAEVAMHNNGWTVDFEADPEAMWDDDVERETTDYDQYVVTLLDDEGAYLESIGSVDLGPDGDPNTDPYIRVLGAELALERLGRDDTTAEPAEPRRPRVLRTEVNLVSVKVVDYEGSLYLHTPIQAGDTTEPYAVVELDRLDNEPDRTEPVRVYVNDAPVFDGIGND